MLTVLLLEELSLFAYTVDLVTDTEAPPCVRRDSNTCNGHEREPSLRVRQQGRRVRLDRRKPPGRGRAVVVSPVSRVDVDKIFVLRALLDELDAVPEPILELLEGHDQTGADPIV